MKTVNIQICRDDAKKGSNNTKLECPQCHKQFKYESERRRHELSHSPHFQCTVCSKSFSFLSALKRHEKQHERKGTVKCEECGGKFRDEILLKRHMNYAHKGTYSCQKCSASFNSEPALHTHLKTHRLGSERRFRCSFDGCGKTFNFSHHLKHHELTHTNAKQHFCTICGKGFIQYHHLKTHLKRHEPQNWLYCLEINCKKKFATEYARKRHLASHKNKPDSGISSDSNSTCDGSVKPNSYTKEQILCSNCGDMITPKRYESHKSECDGNKTDVNKTPDLPIAMMAPKIDVKELTKTFVDNVMSNSVDEAYGLTPIKDTTPENDLKHFDINQSICEGCECASICNMKYAKDRSKCIMAVNLDRIEETPEIVYKTDGTVKIKNIFDIEFSNGEEIKEKNEAKSVPYNSCKAVLGNCIVSGNGTMGEGCLCARMNIDEQQVTAEEIEDIVPHPN